MAIKLLTDQTTKLEREMDVKLANQLHHCGKPMEWVYYEERKNGEMVEYLCEVCRTVKQMATMQGR